VLEDAAGHDRVGDEGDDLHAPIAERTLENVDGEDAAQQRRPVEAAFAALTWGSFGRVGRFDGRWNRDDVRAILGVGGKDAVVADQVDARRRDDRGEPGEELGRLKGKVVRTVGERTLEAIGDAAVGQRAEAGERQRWAGAIATEQLQAGGMALTDVDIGVQGEAVDERTASAEHARHSGLDLTLRPSSFGVQQRRSVFESSTASSALETSAVTRR